MVIRVGPGNTSWHFCNRRVVLFILVKIVLIWISKNNFESSKYRPRCFWEPALLIGILLENILGWIILVVFLLKMTFWACFFGSGLKLVFFKIYEHYVVNSIFKNFATDWEKRDRSVVFNILLFVFLWIGTIFAFFHSAQKILCIG